MSILFFGELPPYSVNGVSLSNELNLKILKSKNDVCEVIETADLKSSSSLSKLLIILRSIKNFYYKAKACKYDYFYFSLPTSKLGGIKVLVLGIIFKHFNKEGKVIGHVHRGDLLTFAKQDYFSKYLCKIIVKYLYKLILLSESQVSICSRFFELPEKKFCFLPNGVESDLISWRKSNLGINSPGDYYLYLSNYIPDKGYDIICSSFSNMKGLHLKMFGNEIHKEQILRLRELVTKNIDIKGNVSGIEKYELIKNCKAVILMSKNEGVPLVILEAMALGKPVITTDVGFIKEMLGDDYPWYVESRSSESLNNLISKFELLSANDYNELCHNLSDLFMKNHSNKVREKTLINIFK
ncbi:MAG: glycosyltransferase [Cognaticolwellia sp.]